MKTLYKSKKCRVVEYPVDNNSGRIVVYKRFFIFLFSIVSFIYINRKQRQGYVLNAFNEFNRINNG